MRLSSLRPLVSVGVAGRRRFRVRLTGRRSGRPPDDEPPPPAFGRPPAAAPPPAPDAAAPPPARPARARRRRPAAPAAASGCPPPDAGAAAPLRDCRPPAASLETKAAPPRRAGSGRLPRPTRDSFLPTLTGPIGLYRVSTAEVGPVQHLRVGLHGQVLPRSGFLRPEADTNTRFSGRVHVRLHAPRVDRALRRHHELEQPQRAAPTSRAARDPELIKSFGDLVLGGKGGRAARARLHRRRRAGVPLPVVDLRPVALAQLDVALDRSGGDGWTCGRSRTCRCASTSTRTSTSTTPSNLYDFTGRTDHHHARSRCSPTASAAAGCGSPWAWTRRWSSSPARCRCARSPSTTPRSSPRRADPSVRELAGAPRNRDQHWMTFGLRARVFQGLTLDAGVDVGLRSVGYEYGPPVPPWDLIFGLNYPFDTASFARPVVVTQDGGEGAPSRRWGPSSATSRTRPTASRSPRPWCRSRAQPRARVATDPDGSFQSVPLPPGPAEHHGRAAGFEPATGKANVVAGSASTIDVALVAKVVNGNVRGRVADRARARPGGARCASTARTPSKRTPTRAARISAVLPAGPYRVTVEATGYPDKDVPLDVAAGPGPAARRHAAAREPGRDADAAGDRAARPDQVPRGGAQADARHQGRAGGGRRHPGRPPRDQDAAHRGALERREAGQGGRRRQEADEQQAAAIKEFLVSKGAPADRIEAVGVGGEAPLVPNLGPANQAKNRRVELVVVQ